MTTVGHLSYLRTDHSGNNQYHLSANAFEQQLCHDVQSVPTWQSLILVDVLRACGSQVRFTLYAEATYDQSWKLAYADPELYKWMLSQRRKNARDSRTS